MSDSGLSAPFSRAKWIGAPFYGGLGASSPPPFLRGDFRLPEGIRSASLAMTALGIYECEINGRIVGDRVFAPGWTDYHKRVQYQTYDVTDHLRAGENAMGVILGDGWYCGHVGGFARQNYGERPALLAELTVLFADGSKFVFASGEGWKASEGPILESDFLMGESHDARREMPGWSEAGFDDAPWRHAVLLPAPEIELNLSREPGVRRQETLPPVSERRVESDAKHPRFFDFGQNFSGRTRIRVRAARGRTLRIRHAEVLGSDGFPYYENLRTARATDCYTCRGEGEEIWEPRFTFHGFRHVEVLGLEPEDGLEIEGVVLHADMPRTGHFACSNPLLNQLQHNILWSQKSNFLEVPTDCPQRNERLGWTGDAQVFIRTACFNMDVRDFFRKWMRDIRDAQWPDGAVPPFVPDLRVNPRRAVRDGGPAWSDAMIICPWTIYLCYGDREILEENYEAMKRYLEFHLRECSRDFIRCRSGMEQGCILFGDWLALDGSNDHHGATPPDLIGTAFLAYDLALMTRIAGVLGRGGDAGRFSELREKVAGAFRRRFVTPDGLLATGTQTAYALALCFGLLPVEARATAVEELAGNIQGRDGHLGTGFVGTPYLLDALEENGRLDLAYRLLEQETFPSWLFPVKNGATTIWERWDGWTPEKGFQDKNMNSFNHYAYGAVGAWMVRSVAGLEADPEVPGYRRVIFRPRPGGTLTWAEAALDSPHGKVGIRWELREGALAVELTIPAGVEAVFDGPPEFAPLPGPLGEGCRQFLLPSKANSTG